MGPCITAWMDLATRQTFDIARQNGHGEADFEIFVEQYTKLKDLRCRVLREFHIQREGLRSPRK
jgi:hypothetical protein